MAYKDAATKNRKQREWVAANREYVRERWQLWASANRDKIKGYRHKRGVAYYVEANRRYRSNPENLIKCRARCRVQYALRTGKLVRPSTCEQCSAYGKIEADHADYNKPLEVKWLCRPCHIAITNERRMLLLD